MNHITTSTSIELNFLGTSCTNYPIFANESTYETNLNSLFHNIVSNATENPWGFYQTTIGDPTIEAVYGHYLCRGDQNTTSCMQCVSTATTERLPKECPNRKIAIIWYDECMVRYSNVSFFDKMDNSFPINYRSDNNITGNSTRFIEILKNMMNNVIAVRAAEAGSLKKFATDFANYTTFQTIYGLAQCTPDLSSSDCNLCLTSSIQKFQESLGGRVIVPSCIVRYEIHPFFDLSYLPLQPSPSPPPPPTGSSDSSSSSGKLSAKVLAAIIIVALLLFLAALVVVCICYRKKIKARKFNVVTNAAIDFTAEALQYDLATLLKATNNFSAGNELGRGGFGIVYKGTLSNGKLIGVKRLSSSISQRVQEFKTEILIVAKLQHRNLVRLLGFCYTEQEKLLVYEYAANKSLDKFIFDHENGRQLDWQSRYNIIIGIARGLLYLHRDSPVRIIHRDLKANNILLDEEMNPKISDFDTIKIFGMGQTLSNYTNNVIGTHGYMSPEYAMNGQFSIKSDAYSFGVVILEIISGKTICTSNQPNDAEDLLTNAWKHWEAETPIHFVEPTIRDSCFDKIQVMRCIQLGLLCTQVSAEDRPTMANVVLTLESHSIALPVPNRRLPLPEIRESETFSVDDVSYVTESRYRWRKK
ncbi:cysteine-rich receptor-like protein kinase 8 [Silene latifolia]|uniref:cysteine-rich receptor-like protein kinase 8 n=1 Tax=Silene latifolia TaxID=37657 RepID=UPI003D78259B